MLDEVSGELLLVELDHVEYKVSELLVGEVRDGLEAEEGIEDALVLLNLALLEQVEHNLVKSVGLLVGHNREKLVEHAHVLLANGCLELSLEIRGVGSITELGLLVEVNHVADTTGVDVTSRRASVALGAASGAREAVVHAAKSRHVLAIGVARLGMDLRGTAGESFSHLVAADVN